MSKKGERLFEAIGNIRDRTVDEAAEKKKPPLRRAGLAAALALAAGAGFLFLLPFGGSAGAGGAGSTGSAFMSYAGPILPLTLREENRSITAERDITLDFAPWEPVWEPSEYRRDGGSYRYSTDILVRDGYTLANGSSRDQTVSVLYPFAASLYKLDEARPVLTLDGRELETVLHAGPYSGGFNGAWGSRREGLPEENLAQADSWEDYRAVLSDGAYRAAALEAFPDLSGIPVAVYEFTDPWGPADREHTSTIRASFTLERRKSTVLTTGFHGMTWDQETEEMTQSFTIPGANDRWREFPFRLVVLGEDLRDLAVRAYDTGGPDGGSVIENAGVTVRRFESDLETVLREIAGEDYRMYDRTEGLDFELYFGLMKDELAFYYDVLSGDPAVRYADLYISESDLDFWHVSRVFYLEAEVTVPAGGRVTLAAEGRKEASYDFHCAHTENQGVYGYGLTPRLGSNLACARQTAALEDRGYVEIVRENFGFDLENGVRSVALDPAVEHYYLEVRGTGEG